MKMVLYKTKYFKYRHITNNSYNIRFFIVVRKPHDSCGIFTFVLGRRWYDDGGAT